MNKVTTKLITDKGEVVQHGTSGFTVTAEREGSDVYTKVEYSSVQASEMREMVAVLLTMLDELEGEKFVASCFARYAEETHKRFFVQENGRKLVLIRGK
jgi:hypothetical protein